MYTYNYNKTNGKNKAVEHHGVRSQPAVLCGTIVSGEEERTQRHHYERESVTEQVIPFDTGPLHFKHFDQHYIQLESW